VDQLIALDADGKVGGWFFRHPHKHRHPPPRRLPRVPVNAMKYVLFYESAPGVRETPRHAAAHMADGGIPRQRNVADDRPVRDS